MAIPEWTDVPDTNLEPGKPIRSIDIIAIKDHAAAMAGAATGAPKVTLQAIEELTAGSTIRSRRDEESVIAIPANTPSQTTSSQATVHSFSFMQKGTIRVYAQHRGQGGGTSNLFIKRTRNGTVTQLYTWSTASTSYIARTGDVSILPGDQVFIAHSVTGTSFDESNVRYKRFQTGGENLYPGSVAFLENTFT